MCNLNFDFKKTIREGKDSLNSENIINFVDYDFFACTCKKNNEEAYIDLIRKNYNYIMKEENKSRIVTLLLKELYQTDWVFKGCDVDQWMGVTFKHRNKNEEMYIQCDELIYAVIAAIEISKKINKEDL